MTDSEIDDARRVRDRVSRALSGDADAAVFVLHECQIALHSLLSRHEMPDAPRLESLAFLQTALDQILTQDKPPDEALQLVNPKNRPPNAALLIRDVMLFVAVGEALDMRRGKGADRADSPVRSAINSVAKAYGVSRDTVQNAWRKLGAQARWAERKTDWK